MYIHVRNLVDGIYVHVSARSYIRVFVPVADGSCLRVWMDVCLYVCVCVCV